MRVTLALCKKDRKPCCSRKREERIPPMAFPHHPNGAIPFIPLFTGSHSRGGPLLILAAHVQNWGMLHLLRSAIVVYKRSWRDIFSGAAYRFSQRKKKDQKRKKAC